MDGGEVIPGLDDGWTFLGAKLMEWASGFVASIMVLSAFELSMNKHFHIWLGTFLGTTIGMASIRKKFPDEEQGVANLVLSSLGFKPPKIPKPSSVQPYWSGSPLKSLDQKKEFVELGIQEMLDLDETEMH